MTAAVETRPLLRSEYPPRLRDPIGAELAHHEDALRRIVDLLQDMGDQLRLVGGLLGLDGLSGEVQYRARDTDGVVRSISPERALDYLAAGRQVEHRRTVATDWGVVEWPTEMHGAQ